MCCFCCVLFCSVLCVHWACVISSHRGGCVCVCVHSCQGVTAGSFCPRHKEAVTTGVWPASRPPAHFTPPPLHRLHHPNGLACPATLFAGLSLFRSALHMGLVSHGNLLSPIRSSRQLGFPSILPALLSGPATSLSVPLQCLHAPASHNQSLSHARNHAKLMGTLSLARGWKQRFVTHLLSVDAVHTPIPFAHTKTDRHTCTPWQGVHSLPCQMLRFVSGLTSCLEHVGVENKGMVSSPYLCGSTLVRITLLNSLASGQGCWKN